MIAVVVLIVGPLAWMAGCLWTDYELSRGRTPYELVGVVAVWALAVLVAVQL